MDGADYSTADTKEAIVDSGTSMLVGPPDAVDQIADALGARKMASTGEYVVSCKKVRVCEGAKDEALRITRSSLTPF